MGHGGTVFTWQAVAWGAAWTLLVQGEDGSMDNLVTETDRRARVRGVQMVQDRTWQWTPVRGPGRWNSGVTPGCWLGQQNQGSQPKHANNPTGCLLGDGQTKYGPLVKCSLPRRGKKHWQVNLKTLPLSERSRTRRPHPVGPH